MSKNRLCGIDEAGRGPLAGNLVIAGVVLNSPIDALADSKKLTPKKREELYTIIVQNSQYHIVSFSPKEVDELGISKCINRGLQEIQSNLPHCDYLFDGNSSFGVDNIETLIKADTLIPEVSASSILAKVTHDRDIIEMSKIYPEYGFEKHKGYGTKAHIEAILKYGRCPIHRESFRVKGLD